MKNYATQLPVTYEDEWIRSSGARTESPALQLVTASELEELRYAIIMGKLPTDLDIKLKGLEQGSLLHRSVEQNCRLFISLLLAAEQSSFTGASRADLDRQ